MSYDFKKINELELVNEVPEGANVLIETEGATKRLPSTAINNGYAKDEVYNKTEAYSKEEVYNKSETYSKDEVYNKNEADGKFLTKETIAKPDWNQNDPDAPDYVKNRTHYEEFKTIIEEREVRAWFEGGTFAASRMPQVGEKLTVTLNGETYKCTAWESREGGVVCLGNGDFESISDRGENVPFFAAFLGGDEGGAGAFIATAMIGENTISIVDDSGNTLLEVTFSVEVDVDEPMYSVNFPLDQPLIVGNTYKVVYDGVPYECVAWEDSGDINLGNGEIDGYEHSEDVPFLITTSQFGELWCLCFFGSGTHTVSVSGMVVHKLDPKYLPDVGAEYDAVFEGYYEQISGTSSWGITWTAGQLVFAYLKAKMANFGKVRAMAKVFHPTLNRTYVAECVSTAYFDEYFGGTLGFTFVFDFGVHFSCYVSQYGDELNLSSTAPD